MQKRVFIVHRWEGNSQSDWYPYIRSELKNKGFIVEIPEMPDSLNPKIDKWVSTLKNLIKNPDSNTFFIGHSIGCQTILRYLDSLNKDIKIGGAIFVSGWFNIKYFENEEVKAIAMPWSETPIDFVKVKKILNRSTAIFSDDDEYVPISDSGLFNERLNSKILIEKGKGHFMDKKYDFILKEFLKLSA
ncbi:alpha/beta hydrolase [Candidatus Woesearchaeota archaeon]|nr:MAG: hypothetical protein QT09_C0003G0050 [archaeon GW2011_AR18]MBS3161257.1 alpha/beta hydrolase [Candidatus Woesearchaeota archaeon]HIH26328.1 hypothetical protein [Nanoarchaeota archaeon]